MECDEVRARLLEYRERQLDLSSRTRLEAHLLVCERCLTELRDLESLLTAFATSPIPEPSPGAAERARLRIAAERRRTATRPPGAAWWWPALPATALLAVIACVAVWQASSPPDRSATRVTIARPAGLDLEQGATADGAFGLWQAPLPEPEVLDALGRLMELSEREIEELLARIRG
jgi:hypothetical protein